MNDQPSRSDDDPSLPQVVTFDAIMPAAMAVRAEESGVKRASTDPLTILVLSVLGGAFVAFGAIFATTVTAGSVAITAPDGTDPLDPLVIVPVVNPALASAIEAADCVASTTFGTVTGPVAGIWP